MKKKVMITVIGSSNTDMVVKTAKRPAPGETVLGKEFLMNPGGKGANQAVAAARLGGEVTFITKTGNDIFGRQALQIFKKEKLNTRYIAVDKNRPSGVALITVDDAGENSIVVAPGANAFLLPEDVEKAKKVILSSAILLLQLEIPVETVLYAAQMASKAGVKVILNPAPAQPLPETLYSSLYLISPNETETEILTGIRVDNITAAQEAGRIFLQRGVQHVIITMGSRGAFLFNRDESKLIPARKVQPVDTTAAGDVFNGALCVALAEGKSLAEAVNFGNKAAAISVTRMGAQASAPYRKEIE